MKPSSGSGSCQDICLKWLFLSRPWSDLVLKGAAARAMRLAALDGTRIILYRGKKSMACQMHN